MESNQDTPQSFALALLTLFGRQLAINSNEPPLGWAFNWDTATSRYDLEARILLPALIQHSPSPATVAQHFITELAKCGNSAVVNLVETLKNNHSASPNDWAAAVYNEITQNGGNLEPLRCVAETYLNELIIRFRNPAGRRDPTSSQSSTPDLAGSDNASLLHSASASLDQVALKELVSIDLLPTVLLNVVQVTRRDGHECPVTKQPFIGPRVAYPHCAHIIPFSIHNKTTVYSAIEMFTGNEVTAADIQQFINLPSNAINIEPNAHISMDQKLSWGIEARCVNTEWKYYYRVVRRNNLPFSITLNDEDEIEFGNGTHGDRIPLPEPRFCNLHLAIARVFAASGFAEVVDTPLLPKTFHAQS